DESEQDFEDNFRYRIIQAADHNAHSNDSRQRCLHRGIVWLYILLIGTVVGAVPYAIDQIITPGKVPVMHIDNMDGRKETLMPPTETPPVPAPKPQAESTPRKPEFPANVVFRNDQPLKQEPPRK